MAFILKERNNIQLIEKTINIFEIIQDKKVIGEFRENKNQFGSKTREQILMEANLAFELVAR